MIFSFTGKQTLIESDGIDSLVHIVSVQEDNTEKLENLLTIATKYLALSKLDSSLLYYERVLSLSLKLENDTSLMDAMYFVSLINKKKGIIKIATEQALKLLDVCDSLNNNNQLARAYNHYGNLISRTGNTDSAVKCYLGSIELYHKLNYSRGIFVNYNSIGNIYKDRADFVSAADYYIKAMKFCEEFRMEKDLGIIYNNLGSVYGELNDFENANKYLKKALEINKKYHDTKKQLASTYNILGNIANKKDKLDEALEYYDQAKVINLEHGFTSGMAHLFNNVGEVYEKQDKLSLALENYEKALEYYIKQNHVEGINTVMKNQIDIFIKLGNTVKASVLIDSCLRMTYEKDLPSLRLDLLKSISAFYDSVGNYRKAIEYLGWYYQLDDSLKSIEKATRIADLESRYENEKLTAENLRLDKEMVEFQLDYERATKARNSSIFIGLGIITAILFGAFLLRYRARKARIIADLKISQLEDEQKVLGAKYLIEGQEEERKRVAQELHDGLGVLLSATKMQFTSLRHKTPENIDIVENATRLLEQASGDVRKISHNMMPGLLTKLGVYEAAEELLENVGETEGIKTYVDISGDQVRLPENKEIMIYRIIQEMVNNTLKHADAKNISLEMVILQDQLNIKYTDDGKGFDAHEKLKSKALGLQSIQSRVNFLNGELSVTSTPGRGVQYHIIIHNP